MAADWHLYMIRCRGGMLYTGITTDVARRLEEHRAGGARGARFLRGQGPLEIVFVAPAADRSQASTLESRVKSLRRDVKEALIAGKVTLSALFDEAADSDNKNTPDNAG